MEHPYNKGECFTVRLPVELKNRIRIEAAYEYKDMSKFVRDLLERVCNERSDQRYGRDGIKSEAA